MKCLSPDEVVGLLERGGLDAVDAEEADHLQSCASCRDVWATIAAADEVLRENAKRPAVCQEPKRGRLALAASLLMCLGIVGFILFSSREPTRPAAPKSSALMQEPTELDPCSAVSLAFSRDGKRLAYVTEQGELFTLGVDGRSKRKITLEKQRRFRSVHCWSAHDKRIACADEREVVVVDVEESRQVGPWDGEFVEWDEIEDTVVVKSYEFPKDDSHRPGQWHLWKLDGKGGAIPYPWNRPTHSIMTGDRKTAVYAVPWDGPLDIGFWNKWIVYRAEEGWSVKSQIGKLESWRGLSAVNLQLSPEGDYVALKASPRDETSLNWVFSVDGTVRRELRILAWARKGRAIVEGAAGGLDLINLQSGERQPLVATGKVLSAAVSPDGSTIVYSMDGKLLQRALP